MAWVIGSQLTAFSSARQGVRIWLRFPRVKSRNVARIRLNLRAFLPLHSTNDFIEFRFVRRFRARRCQVVDIVSDSAHAPRVPTCQGSIQKMRMIQLAQFTCVGLTVFLATVRAFSRTDSKKPARAAEASRSLPRCGVSTRGGGVCKS
jgi:hypothetical protein